MIIYPRIGFDNIKLGYSREQVLELLGEPTDTETEEYPNGTTTEEWSYEELKVGLRFDPVEDYRLISISFFSTTAELEGVCVIGLKTTHLLKHFPKAKRDEGFNNGGAIELREKDVSFWIDNGRVFSFTLFPLYNESTNSFVWPK